MEKLLDWENSHLYNKLGLKWKLARQRCDSTLMMEYVSNYHNVNVIISTILFTLCLTKLISNYYQLHFLIGPPCRIHTEAADLQAGLNLYLIAFETYSIE